MTRRFRNTHIANSVERIAMDGLSKHGIFILPTLRDCFKRGLMPIHGAHSIANWNVFAKGADAGQLNYKFGEPNIAVLRPLLANGKEEDFARSPDIWGEFPVKPPDFVPLILRAIKSINQEFPLADDMVRTLKEGW